MVATQDSFFLEVGIRLRIAEMQTSGRWGVVDLGNFRVVLLIYSFHFRSAFGHGRPSQQLPSSCKKTEDAVVDNRNAALKYSRLPVLRT